MTAAVEIGAIRWVVAGPAGPWRETSSRENSLTTDSREPSLVSVTVLKGELMPVPAG